MDTIDVAKLLQKRLQVASPNASFIAPRKCTCQYQYDESGQYCHHNFIQVVVILYLLGGPASLLPKIHLANGMSLARLALQTVLLFKVIRGLPLKDGTDERRAAAHSKCMLSLVFNLLGIERVECLQSLPKVCK